MQARSLLYSLQNIDPGIEITSGPVALQHFTGAAVRRNQPGVHQLIPLKFSKNSLALPHRIEEIGIQACQLQPGVGRIGGI